MRQPSIMHRAVWFACRTLGRCINAITGGSPRQLLCARAHLRAAEGSKGWAWVERTIDAASARMWPPDVAHCRMCALREASDAKQGKPQT